MELNDDTDGAVETTTVKDKDGRDHLLVLFKRAFRVDPRGRVEIVPQEDIVIDLVDTFNGEDMAKSSIRRPSQVFDWKPGTDVVVLGSAQPPRDQSATYVDTELRVGPIHKRVRAHGLRVWQRGLLGGLVPGPAQPVRQPIPLIYELAWGGQDLSIPEKPIGEPLNYAGRGIAHRPEELLGTPAASLEYPDKPVGGGKNLPAAYNPIHRHWQPRAAFCGTFDESWSESRRPLLPADFNARHHVCVPEDQWAVTPLRGDEPISLTGVKPEGVWSFSLPRVVPGFTSDTDAGRVSHRTHLDTVLIDVDTGIVEFTWRAAVPMPPKYEMLRRIMVVEKDLV